VSSSVNPTRPSLTVTSRIMPSVTRSRRRSGSITRRSAWRTSSELIGGMSCLSRGRVRRGRGEKVVANGAAERCSHRRASRAPGDPGLEHALHAGLEGGLRHGATRARPEEADAHHAVLVHSHQFDVPTVHLDGWPDLVDDVLDLLVHGLTSAWKT